MNEEEAIKILEVGKAEIEWYCLMDYQAALDMAIKALKQPEVIHCEDCKYWKNYSPAYGYCKAKEIGENTEVYTYFCHFCGYAERRENG